MDWDREYELARAAGEDPIAGPSRQPPIRDDDDNIFNDGPPPAAPEPDFDFLEVEETPFQQLTRHWMNERHAPDILPAQEALLTNLLDHLRRQSKAVRLLAASEPDHIRIHLVETEIERVKFIVRSYVRTRLYKIERYARFITTNAEIQTRLTTAERDHAVRHAELTDQHFYLSVLQSLPEAQSHLDDTPLFVPPMITEPDRSRPVFVHALKNCPTVLLPDGAKLDMKKGHVSLMPFAVVEQLVARGEVELI